FALAYQHQVHGELAAGGLEGEQRAQEGVLRTLLIHRATPHAHGAEALPPHESRLERWRAPFGGLELLHVVHEIDSHGGAGSRIELAEHSGFSGGAYELDAREARLACELRHVLGPLRVIPVRGGDRGPPAPSLVRAPR